MCLILFAYKIHPKYPLIVAANRDESYNRPTKAAHFWEDKPHILAGRDLEKMGTWMGVTINGRFSALTNYRNPKEDVTGKLSRGQLVVDAMEQSGDMLSFMNELPYKTNQYPGYNLLAGDIEHLYYYSNIGNEVLEVTKGYHGLSNSQLNTAWPKVTKGKEGLKHIIEGSSENLIDDLFSLLKWAEPFPDEQLPSTGVSLEWERSLSPLFIQMQGYGTRCSTIMLMGQSEVQYIERIYDPVSNQFNDQKFQFNY